MKQKIVLVMGMLALAGLLCAGNAQAQWGDDVAHHGGGDVSELMGALGLDDAQWKKFNELRRKYRRDTIQIQARIDVAEVDLEALADNTNQDLKKIEAKIREIANLRAEMRIYRYRALSEMRGFITGEQFDTFRWMAMKMGFDFGADKDH
ncbi:MAG: periplasmic heavy metal sensor [Nitrospirota bacterium]|nr:periplasmic heavy metal sensor [Nitrospirota bacterium]